MSSKISKLEPIRDTTKTNIHFPNACRLSKIKTGTFLSEAEAAALGTAMARKAITKHKLCLNIGVSQDVPNKQKRG